MRFINLYIILVLLYIFINVKLNTKLNTDRLVTNYIINNVPILKYVHPNIITISGLILNIVIYYLLKTNNNNYNLVIFLILYRWLADILDGGLARKYNKGTKLGNYLDSISDLIMMGIIIYFYQIKIFNISLITYISIYIIFAVIFFVKYDMGTSHDKLKSEKKDNIINNIIVYFINNSIFLYIGLILMYLENIKYI